MAPIIKEDMDTVMDMVTVMDMASKKSKNLGTKEYLKVNRTKINEKLFKIGQLLL
jgi:hypothetical protein